MPGRVAARLKELNLALPDAPAPVANYVPAVRAGNVLYISGQIPLEGGKPQFIGKLGRELSVEQGQQAARLCALNVLAQARTALGGDLDRVVRCVKLGGFVNSTPDFTQHPEVINGASELMIEVLGDAGRHARFAVGAPTLPMGTSVEIDAVFEIAA
jgi:enamine deaminase RidA (YjgF/YER057c/UK114 family)